MKKTLLALALALSAVAGLAELAFVDVPVGGAATVPGGGRLVEVQYFGPAGTCTVAGVRTHRTNALEVATSLSTNTTFTLVYAATNGVTHALATNTVTQARDFLASLPADPGRSVLSYTTNVAVVATTTTNTVSVLAFCATNSLASLTASAGTLATAKTNAVVLPGARLVRGGTATGRATAVLER